MLNILTSTESEVVVKTFMECYKLALEALDYELMADIHTSLQIMGALEQADPEDILD